MPSNTLPSPPEYSLWLLPAEQEMAWLKPLIANLAAQFGTPPFIPHVTIQGDLGLSRDQVATLAAKLANSCPMLVWEIKGTDSSAHFYRSLYLEFSICTDFTRLQEKSLSGTGIQTGLSPFPHLSLAYGEANVCDKSDLILKLTPYLADHPMITFDRLVVARSSCSTPIEEWAILDEFGVINSL